MHKMWRLLRRGFFACLLLVLAGMGAIVKAQGTMTIQATAMGTSTQMGKIVNVNIYIEKFSTVEDRNSLIAAFKKSGQDGMVKVLEDMKPKGRIRFASGGVGNDIKYIMELPSEKGRRLRLVTDRTLAFAELYQGTRSRDYTVGAIELELTPDGKSLIVSQFVNPARGSGAGAGLTLFDPSKKTFTKLAVTIGQMPSHFA